MNRLSRGLNAEFYKWIDDVKRAYRQKAEFEEILKFYESKMASYSSVTYDSIQVHTTNNNTEKKLFFYLQKIDQINSKIKRLDNTISIYIEWVGKLYNSDRKILENLVLYQKTTNDIARELKCSRKNVYRIINNIARIYFAETHE